MSLVSEFWRNVEIFSFPDVLFTDFSCLQEKSVNKTPSENEAWKPFNVVHIRTVRDKDEDGEIGDCVNYPKCVQTSVCVSAGHTLDNIHSHIYLSRMS